MSPSFEERREPVIGTAGMVTAVVGTAFGIGFALELTVPAMLIAAVLAAGMVARSARISREHRDQHPEHRSLPGVHSEGTD